MRYDTMPCHASDTIHTIRYDTMQCDTRYDMIRFGCPRALSAFQVFVCCQHQFNVMCFAQQECLSKHDSFLCFLCMRMAGLRETGGAPGNPAPRKHFLVWIVKPAGCHCTDVHLTSRVFPEDQQISRSADRP